MSVVEERVETTVVPVTRRDVLHRAADLLEEFGWTQGQWGDCGEGDRKANNGAFVAGVRASAFCMVGAQLQALRDLSGTDEAFSKLDFGNLGDAGDINWNDEPTRTKAEVVARLREAAEQA